MRSARPERPLRRGLAAACLAAGLLLAPLVAADQHPGVPPPGKVLNEPGAAPAPAVLRVEPVTVTAGSSVSLNLSGSNLQAGMLLDLGPGISVQRGLQVFDAGHARVPIVVAPGAPAGRHLVTVSLPRAGTPAGGTPLKNEGPGYLEVLAPAGGGPVILQSLAPAQVAQGQSATLRLGGSGFVAGMALSFGPGISAAGSVQVLDPQEATLAIQVAPQAPVLLRHPTLLAAGHDVRVEASATLTVTAGAAAPAVPVLGNFPQVPVVLALAPPRLFTGQSATLSLRGINFVPQMQLDLGPGVHAGALNIVSPSQASVPVQVDASAPPGLRWLGLQLSQAQVPLREDVSLLVQHAPVAAQGLVTPRPAPCTQPSPPHPGIIVLDGPLYTGYTYDSGGSFNVPVLTDNLSFAWHEANPGLADRVELRFYQGGTIIARRSLSAAPGYALPHAYDVDPGLIAELTGKVGNRVPKIVNQHTGNPPPIQWDLTWQVVGFHSYSDSCLSPAALRASTALAPVAGTAGRSLALEKPGPAATHEVVVEQSEAVPIHQASNGDPLLDLPAAPTGLACGGASGGGIKYRARGSGGGGAPPPANASNLFLRNLSLQSQANGQTATAGYVDDPWQLAGSLDVSNAPWSLSSMQSTVSSNATTTVNNEALHNVLLDWGDGTVGSLNVQWSSASCKGGPCLPTNSNTSSTTAFNLDGATNGGAFVHGYNQVGTYTVRVYMLPESQVGQALPASLQSGGGGLYGHLVARVGGAPAGAAQAAADAYLLSCQTVDIQHRTDPVTDGPLQLVDLSITGFPGDTAAAGSRRGPIRKLPAKAAAPASVPVPPREGLPLARKPGGLPGGPPAAAVPQFSSCDVDLNGGAAIGFYGLGTVRLSWYQDGQLLGSSDEPLGPSTTRSDAQLKPPAAAPIESTWGGFESPALNLAQIGQHQLQVVAEVVDDQHPTRRALQALGAYAGSAGAAGGGTGSATGTASGLPPLALLGPRGAAAAGLPALAWVQQAPPGAPGLGLNLHAGLLGLRPGGGAELQADPPQRVVSAPAPYAVTAADPKLPCTFNYPVPGGAFVISGLQQGGKATITQRNGQISGTGTLQLRFADASGTGTKDEPVPIHLAGWTLQPDGVTVASGRIDEHPQLKPLRVPGLTAHLDAVSGTVGAPLSTTLSLSLTNTDLHAANGATPSWQGVRAPLTPQGDWYASGQPMPRLLVYDSGFSLSATGATLDLSATQGQGADGQHCQGGSGTGWMGVLLEQAQLSAYSFNLPNPPSAPAPGWGLDSYGLCGLASFPAGSLRMDQGSIGWGQITATASQGAFQAVYGNLKVHVPWLDTDLGSAQASTQLSAGRNAGQGGILLNLDTPASVTRTEGPITLTASGLRFASVPQAGGWAVQSDTRFDFQSPQGQFAGGVVLHGFNYGMDGAASLADGSRARHLSLAGQKGNIGGSSVDLKSVDVQVPPASSGNRLSFAFDSTLTLSKTLPAADVSVSYAVNEPAQGSYLGSGPVTAPFKIDKPFPDANPSVHLSMTPSYVGPAAGGGKSASGVLFSSNLDMAMFGGPPLSGQFVLGYVGNDDYWLAKAVLDLGPGLSLAPVPLSLFQIGGGMGYNVTLDSFKSSNLTQATPSDDGTLLFDAYLLLGTSDHATAGLSGDFVIKPGGQDPGGRMDYHAWLLDPNWSGQSPIYGDFSYSGGVFDGTLNAQLSLLNDQVALDATHDAVHLHVDPAQWYFHLGTQANPISGHVFFASGQAWADLGSDGFLLGLFANLDLDAGDCGSVCAYVHDNWSLSASITPSPLAFSAKATESFNVGACADGHCLSGGVNASVALGLPPPYLDFGYGLSACPVVQLSIDLQALPSANANVGVNSCF
jgi:hypothetical protein